MIAESNNNVFYNKVGSFFDYWHYDDVEIIPNIPEKKTAEEIEEKIKLKQFCEQIPDHCIQLLFVS